MTRRKLDLTLTALEHLIAECNHSLDEYGNQTDHVAMYLLGCLGILQDDLTTLMRANAPHARNEEAPPTVTQ